MDRVSYYSASGRIESTYEGLCLEAMDDINTPLNRCYGVFDYQTTFIDLTDPENPTPAERPASPVTRTDLTLHDVPNGATLWINGVSYPAEGEVELEFPLPGTFNLRVECFPFLDWTGSVTV